MLVETNRNGLSLLPIPQSNYIPKMGLASMANDAENTIPAVLQGLKRRPSASAFRNPVAITTRARPIYRLPDDVSRCEPFKDMSRPTFMFADMC